VKWTTDKDVDRLLVGLERDGWFIRRTGKQHLLAISPIGDRLSFAYTGSCRRNLATYRCAIAKAKRRIEEKSHEAA
jgi:hypothetical protein